MLFGQSSFRPAYNSIAAIERKIKTSDGNRSGMKTLNLTKRNNFTTEQKSTHVQSAKPMRVMSSLRPNKIRNYNKKSLEKAEINIS